MATRVGLCPVFVNVPGRILKAGSWRWKVRADQQEVESDV